MTDNTYETESLHTDESRNMVDVLIGHLRGADRIVIETKNALGCMDASYLLHAPDVLAALLAERDALEAERDALRSAQSYTYIGKNGKPVLARDLEDERDTLEAQVEGSLTILAQERAEVLKLRAENQRLRAGVREANRQAHALDRGFLSVWKDGERFGIEKGKHAALKGDSHD